MLAGLGIGEGDWGLLAGIVKPGGKLEVEMGKLLSWNESQEAGKSWNAVGVRGRSMSFQVEALWMQLI